METTSSYLNRALLNTADADLISEEEYAEILDMLESACDCQKQFYKACCRVSGLSEKYIEANTPGLRAIVTAPRTGEVAMSIDVHRTSEGYVATFPFAYVALLRNICGILEPQWRELIDPSSLNEAVIRSAVHFGKLVVSSRLKSHDKTSCDSKADYWRAGGGSEELFEERLDWEVAATALGQLKKLKQSSSKGLRTAVIFEHAYYYALLFNLLHEFAHVMLGHFDTRDDIYDGTVGEQLSAVNGKRGVHWSLLSIAEKRGEEEVDKFDKMWSWVKEIEADRYAVEQMGFLIREGDIPTKHQSVYSTQMYLGSLISMAFIEAQDARKFGYKYSLMGNAVPEKDKEHPPAGLRRMVLIGKLAEELEIPVEEQVLVVQSYVKQVDMGARLLNWEGLYLMSGIAYSERCIDPLEVERYEAAVVAIEKTAIGLVRNQEKESNVDF